MSKGFATWWHYVRFPPTVNKIMTRVITLPSEAFFHIHHIILWGFSRLCVRVCTSRHSLMFLSTMNTKLMPLQVIFASKAFSTISALVRFLSTVDSFVPRQIILSFERFTACSTLVLFCTMTKLVPGQTIHASERFSALITPVRCLSTVNTNLVPR